jgi:hypothetical protein
MQGPVYSILLGFGHVDRGISKNFLSGVDAADDPTFRQENAAYVLANVL